MGDAGVKRPDSCGIACEAASATARNATVIGSRSQGSTAKTNAAYAWLSGIPCACVAWSVRTPGRRPRGTTCTAAAQGERNKASPSLVSKRRSCSRRGPHRRETRDGTRGEELRGRRAETAKTAGGGPGGPRALRSPQDGSRAARPQVLHLKNDKSRASRAGVYRLLGLIRDVDALLRDRSRSAFLTMTLRWWILAWQLVRSAAAQLNDDDLMSFITVSRGVPVASCAC